MRKDKRCVRACVCVCVCAWAVFGVQVCVLLHHNATCHEVFGSYNGLSGCLFAQIRGLYTLDNKTKSVDACTCLHELYVIGTALGIQSTFYAITSIHIHSIFIPRPRKDKMERSQAAIYQAAWDIHYSIAVCLPHEPSAHYLLYWTYPVLCRFGVSARHCPDRPHAWTIDVGLGTTRGCDLSACNLPTAKE